MKIKMLLIGVVLLGIGLIYSYAGELTRFVKGHLKDRLTIRSDANVLPAIRLKHDTDYDEAFEVDVSNDVLLYPRTYGKNRFYILLNDTTYPLNASYFKMNDWAACDISLNFDWKNDSVVLKWRRIYDGSEDGGVQRFGLR